MEASSSKSGSMMEDYSSNNGSIIEASSACVGITRENDKRLSANKLTRNFLSFILMRL